MERSRAWAKDKDKEKAEIVRVNDGARERARAEYKLTVREKDIAVQRAVSEAMKGRGRNTMVQGGWHWRLPPRSGPVTR